MTNAITGEPVILEKVDSFDESTLSTFSIHPWQLELEEENYIKEFMMKCKTIIANGPPGIFEKAVFRKSTNEMVDIMVKATRENNR